MNRTPPTLGKARTRAGLFSRELGAGAGPFLVGFERRLLVVRWSRWAPIGLALALLACTTPASPPAAPVGPATPGQPAAGGASQSPGAGAAPTAEPTAPPMRAFALPIATVSATSTPLWVGADQGIFQRYGFDVTVTGLAPAAATQAVQSGTVPFAATSGSTITAFASGARELRYIAGLANRVPFQLYSQPEITRFEDLRGKAVGTSTAGSSTSIALMEILRDRGLEPDRDVSVLYLREQPAILTGLVSGQVAAGFMASPFTTEARKQGYYLLLDTVAAGIDILGLNITSTTDVLQREPEMVRRFLMAWVESVQFARHQRDATVDSIMAGTRNENRAAAEESYDLYRTIWDVQLSPPAIQKLLDASDDVPGAKDVRAEQMIDDRILRELEASGWLAQHLTPP
jgi:ABC-type nitrate/sulfonate/bicarbonate transport system substrate-binding protein